MGDRRLLVSRRHRMRSCDEPEVIRLQPAARALRNRERYGVSYQFAGYFRTLRIFHAHLSKTHELVTWVFVPDDDEFGGETLTGPLPGSSG